MGPVAVVVVVVLVVVSSSLISVWVYSPPCKVYTPF
jgi:hypothetical protein